MGELSGHWTSGCAHTVQSKSVLKFWVVGVIFFLYTIASSEYLVERGIARYIEYIAQGALLLFILIPFLRTCSNWKNFLCSALFLLLITLGLFVQNLSVSILIRLIASLVLIALLMTAGGDAFQDARPALAAGWGICWGLLANLLLGLITGIDVVNEVAEKGWFGIGFNCGMHVKNFAAITAFAAFSTFIVYSTINKWSAARKVASLLMIVVIYLSDSRTTQIALGVFAVLWVYFSIFPRLKGAVSERAYRVIVATVVIVVIVAVILGISFLASSSTYAYRYRGLTNYLNKYGQDPFHMMFGNANMAFGDPSVDYVEAVRADTGWDGTVELPLLSVLIKNGLIGLIGYVAVLACWITKIKQMVPRVYRACATLILLPLLICSVAENYIVNVHIVYMPLAFCVLWGLAGCAKSHDVAEAKEPNSNCRE